MANSLHSFRVSKQRASLKGFTVEAGRTDNDGPPADQETVVQTAFDYLSAKNPALSELVTRMDLVEVGSPQLVPIEPPAQPIVVDSTQARANVAPINPAARERLRTIAANAIIDGTSYTHEEAIARVMETTSVDKSRAQNGLALMLSESIISLTPAGTYFLTGTTPF